jgi:uncharacterized protein YdeI (YjbR/CyaY-like superfamily)
MAPTIPTDLATWMDADTRAMFEGLSERRQRAFVTPIEQAPSRELREWRVAKTVQMLRERRKR